MCSDIAGPDTNPSARPRPFTAYLLFAVPLAAMVVLSAFTYNIAWRSADALIRGNNMSAALITRELVEREFALRASGLEAIARMPGLLEAVKARNPGDVRHRLAAVVSSDRKVLRAFVTDTEGVLWSDFPEAPESLGENFAYRDWFKGVSATWTPYVSPVYQRHAAPQLLLVAVAVPVRDPASEEVLAALVYQVQLQGLADLLDQVSIGQSGYVFLVDHQGNVVAHPGLDLQQQVYGDYAETELVRGAAGWQPASLQYVDPISNEPMLATAAPCNILGERWLAVAQQPVSEAYGPTRTLRWQILAAGMLVTLALAAFVVAKARADARVRRVNRELAHENQERRRAEDRLHDLNEELEQRVEERTNELREVERQLGQAQKMEAIGRLAGGVAHDFNNLLTVISGYAGILLAKAEVQGEIRSEVAEIKGAAQRAATLTRQLLAFSRRQVLQPAVLDVNSLVEGMDKLLRRLIGEDIDLVTKLKPDLQRVVFDPGQIEQIIMNLAVNARDAMPEGGKLIIETNNVELDEEYVRMHPDAQPGPHVLIAMIDTGVGMTPETKAQIFEPFFTTKELGRGTGLGLSTVYGIVKQSGGNIWVYSEPGRGTVFKVYLPATTHTETLKRAPAPKSERPTGTETILVVEDDDAVRILIERVLSGHGYKVTATDRPEDAIEICRARGSEIDLLLTDVVMPGTSGREMSEAIREFAPDMRIVFMSGYTDDAIVHHGILESGVAFIEKPISPDVLLRKIREYIE